MNEWNERAPEGPDDAQGRIAEISRLFVNLRGVLDQMVGTIDASREDAPQAVIAKLNELQAAHQKVLAAEEAFHAHQGKTDSRDDVDFETIRADIGCQLDRLRAAAAADKLS